MVGAFNGLNFNKNIHKEATVAPAVAGNYGFMAHVYMIHEPQAFEKSTLLEGPNKDLPSSSETVG